MFVDFITQSLNQAEGFESKCFSAGNSGECLGGFVFWINYPIAINCFNLNRDFHDVTFRADILIL